ncbi:MAG TPA: hypothetical protein VK642_08470 [Burkholderiales bacterium]|nr:hypothetical protein [Burkholderiales bacterium]
MFSDGALVYSRRIVGIQDTLGARFVDLRSLYGSDINRTWDYSYEGGTLLAPPFEFKTLEVSDVTAGNNFSIVWALTGKLADAIIRPLSSNLTTFRSIDITGKSYVADASPLGEVFFATTDRSIVIHEPKGSTPRIVIPPNVVQLLAAVWF